MNSPTFEVKASSLPIGGTLVRALLAAFCMKPYKGDDSWPECSVGVAQDSLSATDSSNAIIIGDPKPTYEATQRKEVLIEAERSRLYGLAMPIDTLERMKNLETGEIREMPAIGAVVAKNLDQMRLVASLPPEALGKIAAIAAAANADSVEIYQPNAANVDLIGFKFKFAPDPGHINLFTEWEGKVPVRGVVSTRKRESVDEVKDASFEIKVEAASDPKPKGKKKSAYVITGQSGVEAESSDLAPSHLTVIENIDPEEIRVSGGYQLPPLSILETRPVELGTEGEHAKALVTAFHDYGITAMVRETLVGPTITQYGLEIPRSVTVSRVAKMHDDLRLHLGVKHVLIQAPIPGKKLIGVQIPNSSPKSVLLRDVIGTAEFMNHPSPLMFALGLDITGRPVYADLTKMPHLLIAGATNSGKSIGLATIISSLVMRNSPRDLRFVMIDPKKVELSLFGGLPHLAMDVVTECDNASEVLRAMEAEMEDRYRLLEEAKVRNIDGYNAKVEPTAKLPYFVIVIDELADLMMTHGNEVESSIVRLAQKARAVGIHLIVATQRPSSDIITGLIKSNIPSRIAFSVASGVDSRVILDKGGAENLIGRGDMLFSPMEANGDPVRIQGAYISESELEKVVGYWGNR